MLLYLIYPVFCIFPIISLVLIFKYYGYQFWILPIFYFMILLIVLLLEKLFPWANNWNRNHHDKLLDLVYLLTNLSISQLGLLLYSYLHSALDINSSISQFFSFIEFLIALLIFDLGLYLIHRLSHNFPFLWKLHAIHHSSERVYSVNGQKRHLLHELLEGTPGFVCLFLIGVNPAAVALAVYAVNIHLLFQHGNMNYRIGFFKYIFSVAELHRWHHQRDWKEVQGNYGAFFSIWDVVSNTILRKKGTPSVEVGLGDTPYLCKLTFIQQQKWPFQRKKTTT